MEMSLAEPERFIPKLDWEMPVEVMKDFDTMLMFGKLAAVSPEGITIRRMLSEVCFPIMEAESKLLIRCYDLHRAPVILRARVIRSSGMECTAGELELIPYHTQRKEIRYPLCPPAMISVLDDTAGEQLQPCQLLNISAGGACIVAGGGYTVGQVLRLQVSLAKADGCMSCSCKVTRVTPWRGGCFEYGLFFEKLDKKQIHYLEEFLQDYF